MSPARFLLRLVAYVWAAPNTLVGLLVAIPDVGLGGRGRIVSGVLEVHGPLSRVLLRRAVPLPGGAMAVTLGHVVLGSCRDALESTRRHERVHVAQYELWGPFFLPAYLLSSIWIRLRGGAAYLDNWFERQARDRS